MDNSLKSQLDLETMTQNKKRKKLEEHSRIQMDKFNSNILPIKLLITIKEVVFLVFFIINKLIEIFFKKTVLCPIALAVGCKKCPVYKLCPAKAILGDEKKEE